MKFSRSVPVVINVASATAENTIDPTIFKVKMMNSDLITDPITKNGKVPNKIDVKELKACEESDFEEKSTFSQMGFKNAFCMKDIDFTLGGYWDEQEVSYLYFYLERCNNKTSDVICKSEEEIDQFFIDRYFGFYMPNTFFDMNDYETPMKYTWRTEYQMVDFNMMKRIKSFIKKTEFFDDKGIVLEDKKLTNAFTYDISESDFVLKPRSQILFEVYMYSSAFVQKKVRKYEKASEILAAIGGQASFLMIFGFLLTQLTSYLEITSKVMNILYRFQNERDDKDRKGKRGQTINKFHEKAERKDEPKTIQTALKRNFQEKSNLFISKSIDVGESTNVKLNAIKTKPTPIPALVNNSKSDTSRFAGYVNQKNLTQDSLDLSFLSEELVDDPAPAITQEVFEKTMRKYNESLSNESHMNFGLKDYLKLSFSQTLSRKKTHKEKLFEKALKRFSDEIDIIRILQRLQDLEKLKLILLTPQQRELLFLIQKPMIYTDSDEDDEDDEPEADKKNPNNNKSKQENPLTFFGSKLKLSGLIGSVMGESQRKLQRINYKRAWAHYSSLKNAKIRSEIDDKLVRIIDSKLQEFKQKFE